MMQRPIYHISSNTSRPSINRLPRIMSPPFLFLLSPPSQVKIDIMGNKQDFIQLFTTEWLQKRRGFFFFFYSFFYCNVHVFHFFLHCLELLI